MNEENNELMPKFDPQTGEKLVKNSDSIGVNFDTKTDEPISNKEVLEAKTGNFKKLGDKVKRHKVITAVAVTIGIVGIGAGVFLNTPKIKVTRGFKKTFEVISNYETPIDEKLGKTELLNTILKGKSQQELQLNINKIPGETDDLIKNMGINIKFANDVKANKLMTNIATLYKDDILFNTSIYNDKEQVMFYIPELYDEYFYLNKKDLKNKFEDSALGEYLSYNMSYDGEGKLEDLNANVFQDFFAKYLSDNRALLKDTYSQIVVEKSKERHFKVNGKNKACKGYTITIPKKAVKQLISNFNKAIQNDDEIENMFLCMGMSDWDYENMLDNIDMVLEGIKDGIQEDVVYKVYMNSKGEIIYLESESELEVEDDDITASIEVDLSGGKNIYDNLMFECTLEKGRERIGLSFERESSLNNNQYEASNEIRLMDISSEITINSETSFNQKTGDFDVLWQVENELDDVISMELEGKLKNIKKSKGFDAVLDAIKLTNEWDEQIVLEGTYSVSELKEPIEKLSNKGEDLLDSSYDDIIEILYEMGQNLEEIGQEIY